MWHDKDPSLLKGPAKFCSSSSIIYIYNVLKLGWIPMYKQKHHRVRTENDNNPCVPGISNRFNISEFWHIKSQDFDWLIDCMMLLTFENISFTLRYRHCWWKPFLDAYAEIFLVPHLGAVSRSGSRFWASRPKDCPISLFVWQPRILTTYSNPGAPGTIDCRIWTNVSRQENRLIQGIVPLKIMIGGGTTYRGA